MRNTYVRKKDTRLRPMIPTQMADRITTLAAEAEVSREQWVITALESFIMEHRSKRPLQLDPARFDDRVTGDFESICL